MRYADYYDCDICNGNSVGMSLFVSGCPFQCQGCFNSDIWDFNTGKEWTKEIEDKFLKLVGRDYIKRVTLVGGSPLCDENVKDVCDLITRIHKEYPDKQIWVYTGYKWEDIFDPEFRDSLPFDLNAEWYRSEVLDQIDVLVDGPFECDRKDLSLAFRGSSNQRIIDVQKSIESGEVVLWNNEDKGGY